LAKEQARSIEHVAQFERADAVWKDGLDANPRRLAFTTKPRQLELPRANRFPAESSDVEMNDDCDGAPFIPHSAVGSVPEDDSAVKS